MRAPLGGELGQAEGASHVVPIGAARVDAALIRAWLNRQRAGASCMSIDHAARQLGFKQQVAYDLVRRGLLQAARAASGDVVQQEALLRFTETFISLADVARRFDISPKAMLHRPDAAPVTGPAVD